jgi:hypothetical protein
LAFLIVLPNKLKAGTVTAPIFAVIPPNIAVIIGRLAVIMRSIYCITLEVDSIMAIFGVMAAMLSVTA